MLVAGPGMDCILNAIFFIAGVIPGHIHGFYITCTYFHRKRKVKKGRYPGGRKTFIFSEQVWNGGASNQHVKELLVAQKSREQEEEDIRMMKRSSRSSRANTGLGRMPSSMNTGLGARGGRVWGRVVLLCMMERRGDLWSGMRVWMWIR
jgi:Proteolipid membrane potential modulator